MLSWSFIALSCILSWNLFPNGQKFYIWTCKSNSSFINKFSIVPVQLFCSRIMVLNILKGYFQVFYIFSVNKTSLEIFHTAFIVLWYRRLTLSDVIGKIPVWVKLKTCFCTKHSGICSKSRVLVKDF